MIHCFYNFSWVATKLSFFFQWLHPRKRPNARRRRSSSRPNRSTRPLPRLSTPTYSAQPPSHPLRPCHKCPLRSPNPTNPTTTSVISTSKHRFLTTLRPSRTDSAATTRSTLKKPVTSSATASETRSMDSGI